MGFLVCLLLSLETFIQAYRGEELLSGVPLYPDSNSVSVAMPQLEFTVRGMFREMWCGD